MVKNVENPLLTDPPPFECGEVVAVNGGRYQVVTHGSRFVRLQGVPESMELGRGAEVREHAPIVGEVCHHCGAQARLVKK